MRITRATRGNIVYWLKKVCYLNPMAASPITSDGRTDKRIAQALEAIAFGTAVLDPGISLTWEELLEASRRKVRPRRVELQIREIDEIVRTPDLPLP